MNIVSLISDFGLSDNFVGAMKAVILKINHQAKIIDICHQINPGDIKQAAFLLRSSFKYFPIGTVHFVVVDPGVGSPRKKIIAKTKNYYFVAPDNGVLSLTLKDEPAREIIEITNDKYFLKPTSDTFHGRDIFAPVSAYISKGENISKFGKKIKSIKTLDLPKLKKNIHKLSGEIIYIDHFGNLVSNIEKSVLMNFIKKRKFKIQIKNKTIDKLSRSYSEGPASSPLAIIDSFNHLEIAVNGKSARDYLKASIGDKITVTC